MLKPLILSLLAASTLHAAVPGGDVLAGLIIEQFDMNSDEVISRFEWESGVGSSFGTLDANGDQLVTLDEADGIRGDIVQQTGEITGGIIVAIVKQALLALDTDGDKTISKKEYDTLAVGIFDKLDADKNGSLTRAELADLPLKLIAK